MPRPKVSVLMPVYNGVDHLGTAVDSILGQDFDDFELLIVDDGSTDGSAEVASALRHPRVRAIHADHRGLVAALNFGLDCARGEYVARMDADDIAREDRLGIQVDRLAADPGLGLVCSNVRIIDGQGRLTGAQRESWPSSSFVRDGLLYQLPMKPIIHPSVMVRREVLDAVGGYRDFPAAEDRDLWLRALDVCRFDRIQEDLLDYRIHAGGVSRQAGSSQEVASAMAAVNRLVYEQTGVDVFVDRRELFRALTDQVRERIEKEVLPQALVFRSARSLLRNRRRFTAVATMALGYARHGSAVRRDGARRGTARIILDAVETAHRAVAVEE